MSFETQHDTNEDSPIGGEEEQVGEFKAWHITNEDSLTGGEEEGGVSW